MEYIKDLWLFLKERKKWWLAPIIIILLLIGILLVFGGGTAFAPFIYTLFYHFCHDHREVKRGYIDHFHGISYPLFYFPSEMAHSDLILYRFSGNPILMD